MIYCQILVSIAELGVLFYHVYSHATLSVSRILNMDHRLVQVGYVGMAMSVSPGNHHPN